MRFQNKPVAGSLFLGGGTAEKFGEGDVFVLKKSNMFLEEYQTCPLSLKT